jgi:cytochrome c oxidase subunit 3
MHPSTLVIALLTAIVVWFFLVRQLTARPWMHGVEGENRQSTVVDMPATKIGLWVFLGLVTSLFLLFTTAYSMRMDPQHASDWVTITKPGILWLNTGFLIAASIAMQWAHSSARLSVQGDTGGNVRVGLTLGGLLTLLFLAGQLWAWQIIRSESGFSLANPAAGFFYLLTAVHGLHLLGGLWVWGRAAAKAWSGVETRKIALSVELCTWYWHFLLLVWFGLFALLMST